MAAIACDVAQLGTVRALRIATLPLPTFLRNRASMLAHLQFSTDWSAPDWQFRTSSARNAVRLIPSSRCLLRLHPSVTAWADRSEDLCLSRGVVGPSA